MSEEQVFLDALAAAPDDGLTRLAYADWLEERGDPRAELLRLEEAPRAGGPPPRLLALHGTLDAEWVLRVSRSAPLAELRLLAPPPRRQVRPRGDWAAVEAVLGLRLPEDYKAFLDLYGLGMINHCLEVPHPFASGGGHEFWDARNSFIELLADTITVPYPVYPEPGGLVFFWNVGDTAMLGWLTAGAPHEWPLLYADPDGFVDVPEHSSVGLITELVSRRSPLLERMGLESAFEPFTYFEPSWGQRGAKRLQHPERLDLASLAARLVGRWPVGEARVQSSPTEVYILADLYEVAINLVHESDGTTSLTTRHGPDSHARAREIWAEMRAIGFRVLW
jgi:uncharacterized protein (TIGR02996 family)